MEESSSDTDVTCGSVYLDLGFENLLRRKLGSRAKQILIPKTLQGALNRFDLIKREFNPMDGDFESGYDIYLRNAPELPHIGLEEGHLKLTRYAQFLRNFCVVEIIFRASSIQYSGRY